MTTPVAVLSRSLEPRPGDMDLIRPMRFLSLTGGGYRGLFTSQVLVELCNKCGRDSRLVDCFDGFAGTSIGGLMACALAVGVPAAKVASAIESAGPTIFKRPWFSKLRRRVIGAVYDSSALREAVQAVLGKHAKTRLSDISVPLLVPALNWQHATLDLFMSGGLGTLGASPATLEEVCMATSAAPTYFKPAQVRGVTYLDGGLGANNPDVLLLLQIARSRLCELDRVHLLSVGTAGAPQPRRPGDADRSELGWVKQMPELLISTQEHTAIELASGLLGDRYLRVNHLPTNGDPAFESLDLATDGARKALRQAAVVSAAKAHQANKAWIERVLTPLS